MRRITANGRKDGRGLAIGNEAGTGNANVAEDSVTAAVSKEETEEIPPGRLKMEGLK